MPAHLILVTGGQRSGKSAFAERLALSLSQRPVYMATARIGDEEFRQRVRAHQLRRGSQWTNIEEDRQLSRHNLAGRVVLIDCLTLWATNFFCDLMQEGTGRIVEQTLQATTQELDRLAQQDTTLILVTNELGCGGISPNQAQRQFTDVQGVLNQHAAAMAQDVFLLVSGIPVRIKGDCPIPPSTGQQQIP